MTQPRLIQPDEPQSGSFQPRINTGGRGQFCWFDYRVEPAPDVTGVTVELDNQSDPDTYGTSKTDYWFPSVKAGIERELKRIAEEDGIQLVHTRVSITAISSHDIDTSAEVCERRGAWWISTLVSQLASRS